MELGESIPDDELREMVDEADRDQDGFVVFEDFYRIMKKPSDDDVSGVFLWGGGPCSSLHTASPLLYTPLYGKHSPHTTLYPLIFFYAGRRG